MNKEMIDLIKQDCYEVTANQIGLIDGLKNQCILVTGGTGFVGTWISELIAYLNDEYKFNIQLQLLAQDIKKFKEKVPHLVDRKDIRIIEQDVTCLSELPTEITHIIHAAANPDNRMHASDPLKVAQVITNGTYAVLDASVRLQNLQKIVNISSGLIYGPQPLGMERIPENFNGGPDCSSSSAVYAEAKRYGEMLCAIYRARYKLDIVNVRPFAFVGPYQLLDRPWAINNFIREGLLGGPIRILGDGETIRSYMYASDMAFWMLKILSSGVGGANYNIGSPVGIALKKAAELVVENLYEKPQISINKSFSDHKNRSVFVPDIAKSINTLGLKLTVGINSAIQRTLKWNTNLVH